MGSWGSIFNSARWGLQYQMNQMAKLQEQVTTGSKIIRVSDSPASAYRIMDLQETVREYENYEGNLTEVEVSLKEVDSALNSVSDLVNRAGVLATQAANGTYMANSREAIALEIDSILEQVISRANHKVMGRHLFGGADSYNAPYVVTKSGGMITSVEYEGSYKDQPVPVGPGVTYSGQMVGEEVFRSHNRQPPVIVGNTGAAVGTGTPNARGDLWLNVTHDTTTYNGTTVAAGTSSATGDTVLGANHTITVDALTATSGTISLDGGPTVEYDNTMTDLKVTSPNGDVIYVDTTTPPVTGTFTMNATGKIAIGDGPPVAIDFTEDNLSLTDPVSDKFIYIDARNIERTGSDTVRIPGTYDLFGALISLRDNLLNKSGLEVDDQLEAIGLSGDALAEISSTFRQKMTIVGGRLGGIDRLRDTLDEMKFNTKSESESIQQADIAQVATDLARTETLYQMSLAVTGKAVSLSLFNYL